MKKIFKFWFTLVELLVIAWIISIIWFFSVWSFVEFYKNQEFQTKITKLESFLKEQDLEINFKNIYNYEINFEVWKNFFIANLNNIDLETSLKIDENKKFFVENFSSGKKGKDSKILFYKNWKLFKTFYIFDKNRDYWWQISSAINWEEGHNTKYSKFLKNNSIWLEYSLFSEELWKINFSKPDDKIFYLWDENKNSFKIKYFFEQKEQNSIILNTFDSENLVLKNLSNTENKSQTFSKLKIENIWWKKKLFLDGNLTEKVYLFFENKDWKEFYLIIKN